MWLFAFNTDFSGIFFSPAFSTPPPAIFFVPNFHIVHHHSLHPVRGLSVSDARTPTGRFAEHPPVPHSSPKLDGLSDDRLTEYMYDVATIATTGT